MSTWSKIEELMDFVKAHDIKELRDYFNKREAEEKRNNTLLWIFAAIGAVVAVAAIAYAVYRYFTPDYLEDFDDEFEDDDFDDEFEDDEDEAKKEEKPVENAANEEDFAE